MTIRGQVVVTLLLFLSCVIQGNGDPVAIVDQLMRCNKQRYDEYDKTVDDVLNGLGQRVDEHHGLGFNTYYSSFSSHQSSHGHACCHTTLIEQDCSRCIHNSLDQIRHRCGHRIGGFVSLKQRGGNYACEVRYEKYDIDDDYFSCSRY